MKAFIAVTLLAACVAAQIMDRPTQTGLFLNNPLLMKTIRGDDLLTTRTMDLLTVEEIMRQPLFQTYVTLPLFRQHMSHPLFQLYLTRPEFQKYWIYPEFQNFFRNPVLFYKYIYPVVFGQTLNMNTMVPFNGEMEQQMVRPVNVVMDKIIKDLIFAKTFKTVDRNMIKPIVDEQTLRKSVDALTGEIKYTTLGDLKTVDDKMMTLPMETMEEGDFVKAAILKKLFLNKIFGNKLIVDTVLPETMTMDKIDTTILAKINEILMKYDYLTATEKYQMINDFLTKVNTLPINKYETLPIVQKYESLPIVTILEKINELLINHETLPISQKYDLIHELLTKMNVLPIVNKYEKVNQVLNMFETLPVVNKYDKIMELMNMNKFDKLHLINKYDTTIPMVNKYESRPIVLLLEKINEILTKYDYLTVTEKYQKINELLSRFDIFPIVQKYETLPVDKIEKINELLKLVKVLPVFNDKYEKIIELLNWNKMDVLPLNKYDKLFKTIQTLPMVNKYDKIMELIHLNKYDVTPMDFKKYETMIPLMKNFDRKYYETVPMVTKYDTEIPMVPMNKYEKINNLMTKFNRFGKINEMNRMEILPTMQKVNDMYSTNIETMPMPTMQKVNEIIMNKMEIPMEKVNMEVEKMDKIPTMLPILNRSRRHAVATPVTGTYNYNTATNTRSLNYYTVPTVYGAQTQYYTPLTYTVPTTYSHQYQYVQPNLVYPAQTIYG
jgi:hypothetical protein